MTTGVRPLDVEPEPPHRGTLVAAAAVLALGGFGLFLANGALSPSTPTTTTEGVTTTAAAPPPAIISATTGEELRQLVPGFQGAVRGIVTETDGGSAGWSWFSGEVEPRLTELPEQSAGSWAPGGSLLAAIGSSSFGRSLFAGPPTNIREVFNAVESFAWHSSEHGALALVTVPQSDGLRELWHATLGAGSDGGGFSASRMMRFDYEATLVAYGDWGHAMSSTSPSQDRPIQLITLESDGGLIAAASFIYLDNFGDGRLLVRAQPEAAEPPLATVGVGLGDAELIAPDATFGGVLSPNRRWAAAVSPEPAGAILWLSNVSPLDAADPVPVSLGADFGIPVAWSPDGRWILLRGFAEGAAQWDGTKLIFVDLGSMAVHSVITPGSIDGLTVDATGFAGPSAYFAP